MPLEFTPPDDTEDYPEWVTPTQIKYLEALKEYGSHRKAAIALGCGKSAISDALARYRKTAAKHGHAPGHFDDGVAPGYRMGKVTIQRANGLVERVWERQHPDEIQRDAAFRAAVEEACRAITPLPRVCPPAHFAGDLLNLYVFTDYHLGMRAWSEEGGADWNLQIAEDLIIRSFAYMLENTPAAEVGFIAQIGDFAHFDGLRPVTPTSGHVVDASSHYAEIVRAIIRIKRRLVEMALAKHSRVVVLDAEGNHDIASSVWMREISKAWYADEPRVEVVDSASPFYAYEWGVTMLGFHHGHCAKKLDMAKLFANLFAPMWGRTTRRYGKRGHYHHEVVVDEDGGMKTTQYPTLAPSDSHAARHGLQSVRQTMAETFSRRFGKASEIVVTPEMLGAFNAD